MSFRDRRVYFTGFVRITLVAVVFLLPLLNSFLTVCLPTLFAVVLKFFQPITASTVSGSAKSSKSEPTRFHARTIYLRRGRIKVLPTTCASTPDPRPRCLPIPL